MCGKAFHEVTQNLRPKLLVTFGFRNGDKSFRPDGTDLAFHTFRIGCLTQRAQRMTRIFWATVALLSFATTASATLDRPKYQAASISVGLAVSSLPVATAAVESPQQAEITGETQVFLNGKRSEFKDIPPAAAVDRVVLAADGKTIVRIEFSTAK